MFNNVYAGKRVMVTGHTGFKGGWLTTWLCELGAHVLGYSNSIPTEPSLYGDYDLQAFDTQWGEITDKINLLNTIEKFQPDFIFHLAAQPIVSTAYEDPYSTFHTNIMGSVALVEALRNIDYDPVTVFITSDKCYENVEWLWGYRENDYLGGKDPYSASKACAEIICRSYYLSFLQRENTPFATARAGNVIGGGDWARNRIIVDAIEAWKSGNTLEIRSPNATRPWQHVLEPLSGYLMLGEYLFNRKAEASNELKSFNFGPDAEAIVNVQDIVTRLSRKLGNLSGKEIQFEIVEQNSFHEAGLLSLNCDKAKFVLNWRPNLSLQSCIEFIAEWVTEYYDNNQKASDIMIRQIRAYHEQARRLDQAWA